MTQMISKTQAPVKRAGRIDPIAFFERFGVLIFMILLLIFFQSQNSNFFSERNIFNILTEVSIYGIMAVGMTFVILSGGIDLSVGAVIGFTGVLVAVAVTLVGCGMAGTSLVATTLLFMLCFAALGAGNGALFQLVPLRWPLTTAVAGSMIGEIGALGGGFLPNAMGQSKQLAGTYLWGFVAFAALTVGVLVMMRFMQLRWTRTWAEKGGRARAASADLPAVADTSAIARV